MRLPKERYESRDQVGQASGLAARCRRTCVAAAPVALLGILMAPALFGIHASAQNQKKQKNDPESTGIVSPVALPDSQAVDMVVGQMLGAWQIGDVEMLHKYYADDVAVVSGAWEPPLLGWESYARAYQAQYARTSGGRLERTNTLAKVLGDDAWVTYQWQFSGQVDGKPTSALGHTTLLLQKRAGNWVIVLNHTSAVPESAQPAAASAAYPQAISPAAQAGPSK